MKSVNTNTGIKIQGGIKEIIFLNNHKINSKLTVELIKRGIKVKPFSTREKVTEKSEKKEFNIYDIVSLGKGRSQLYMATLPRLKSRVRIPAPAPINPTNLLFCLLSFLKLSNFKSLL